MRLVAVVRGLVGAVDRDIKIFGLDVSEDSEFHSQLSKVSTCDLLVELFREDVHTKGELLRCGPKSDLCKNLVRKRT